MPPTDARLSALILAGGRGRRLGGRDKGLLPLAGKPLAAWVIERLRPQVDDLVISANRHVEAYARLGCAVVTDTLPGQPGPLAGLLAAAAEARADWLLAAPCDTPLLPDDLARRMLDRAHQAGVPLVRAADAERSQYAIMLFQRALLPDMAAYLAAGGHRVQAWQARHAHAEAVFTAPHAFFNINTAADLALAESLVDAAGATPVD